jgi:hypothetical protein
MVAPNRNFPDGEYRERIPCGHLFPVPLLSRFFKAQARCPVCGSAALNRARKRGCLVMVEKLYASGEET